MVAIRSPNIGILERSFAAVERANEFAFRMSEQRRIRRDNAKRRKRAMRNTFILTVAGGALGASGAVSGLSATQGAQIGAGIAQLDPKGTGSPEAGASLFISAAGGIEQNRAAEQNKQALINANRDLRGEEVSPEGFASFGGPPDTVAALRALEQGGPGLQEFAFKKQFDLANRQPNIQFLKQADGTFLAVDRSNVQAGTTLGEPSVDPKVQARINLGEDRVAEIDAARSNAFDTFTPAQIARLPEKTFRKMLGQDATKASPYNIQNAKGTKVLKAFRDFDSAQAELGDFPEGSQIVKVGTKGVGVSPSDAKSAIDTIALDKADTNPFTPFRGLGVKASPAIRKIINDNAKAAVNSRFSVTSLTAWSASSAPAINNKTSLPSGPFKTCKVLPRFSGDSFTVLNSFCRSFRLLKSRSNSWASRISFIFSTGIF